MADICIWSQVCTVDWGAVANSLSAVGSLAAAWAAVVVIRRQTHEKKQTNADKVRFGYPVEGDDNSVRLQIFNGSDALIYGVRVMGKTGLDVWQEWKEDEIPPGEGRYKPRLQEFGWEHLVFQDYNGNWWHRRRKHPVAMKPFGVPFYLWAKKRGFPPKTIYPAPGGQSGNTPMA